MGVRLGELSDIEIDALEYLAGLQPETCPPIDVVARLIRLKLAAYGAQGVRATRAGLRLLLEAGLLTPERHATAPAPYPEPVDSRATLEAIRARRRSRGRRNAAAADAAMNDPQSC